MTALDNICARPPAHWVVWIHRIHTAGEANGSTTMVVMLIVCSCCVLQSLLVVALIVCKKVPKHNLKVCILPYYQVNRHYFLAHPCVHHTMWNISSMASNSVKFKSQVDKEEWCNQTIPCSLLRIQLDSCFGQKVCTHDNVVFDIVVVEY